VFIALTIVTVLLAAMLAMSASMKLRKQEQAVAVIGGTVGALTGHLRVGDTKNVTMPLPPLALSVAVLALQLLTV
jgi:hypothetical protein